MDITFLVGNGFDLSLDYKTSYADFYKHYLNRSNGLDNKDSVIFRLKKSIAEDRKRGLVNWVDFEIGLGKFTNKISPNEVNEFIDAYTDALQELHDYFLDLPKNKSIDTISDAKWAIFRKNLCYFYQDSNEQDIAGFSRLKLDEQANGREAVFHFVSFNYTNFLDEYVDRMAQTPLETWKRHSEVKHHTLDPNVLHVHGTLDDYPILGVSNLEQIANQDLRKNILLRHSLIKPNSITFIGSPRYTRLEALINRSRIVCLWGVSLGDSDKHWWNYIVKWLKDDPNRSLFIFEYTKYPPSNFLIPDLYRKRSIVTNRLLSHSDLPPNEKQNLDTRIHVIFNTRNVLSFPKAIKTSLLQ